MTSTNDTPMRPEDDPSWAAYPETVLEIVGARVVRLDLRSPLTAHDRRALARVGLGAPFAVVTAWNPYGVVGDADANRRRDARLRAALDAADRRWLRADGVSPDARHREVGVAVTLSLQEATALAQEFGQSAFFWFDGADVWLMPALVRSEPRRLSGSAPG